MQHAIDAIRLLELTMERGGQLVRAHRKHMHIRPGISSERKRSPGQRGVAGKGGQGRYFRYDGQGRPPSGKSLGEPLSPRSGGTA